MQQGYSVTATEPVEALAELAEAWLGQPVRRQTVQNLTDCALYDGIWACASLLHLLPQALPDAFLRLARALKPDGVLYASFKLGSGVRQAHGRTFTDLDSATLATLTPDWHLLESWISDDNRPDRADQWLNAILRCPASTK